MPIRRIEIPLIDCGDEGGCLSEFISIIVFILFYVIGLAVILGIIGGICCGLANLFG